MRQDLVNTAYSQVGYVEGDDNWNKYGEWYGMNNEPWCDIFVSWCSAMSDIPESIIPKFAYVPDTANFFDKRGEYKNSYSWGGDYVPRPGDLILFDYDRTSISDHIGIVVSVMGSTIRTVEGNKDNGVKECAYDLKDRTIRAYCKPNYSDENKPVNVPYKFRNTSGQDIPVYSDLFMNGDSFIIGYLNKDEACSCFGKMDEGIIVLYKVDNSDNNWKVGFVWSGNGVIE
jgi:hypothetical protein